MTVSNEFTRGTLGVLCCEILSPHHATFIVISSAIALFNVIESTDPALKNDYDSSWIGSKWAECRELAGRDFHGNLIDAIAIHREG